MNIDSTHLSSLEERSKVLVLRRMVYVYTTGAGRGVRIISKRAPTFYNELRREIMLTNWAYPSIEILIPAFSHLCCCVEVEG